MPALSRMAASALRCSSAPNTGLRTSRLRSALSAISASNAFEIGLDRVDGLVFERELEQGGGIAASHAGNDRVFACHWTLVFVTSFTGRTPSRNGGANYWNPRGNSDLGGRRGSPRKPPEIEG